MLNPPRLWRHAELGVFKFILGHWEGTICLPAFDRFVDAEKPPPSPYRLCFKVGEEAHEPSVSAIQIVREIIQNQNLLAPAIASALWNSFNGTGPSTGIWWHNCRNSDDEFDECEEIAEMKDIDELFQHMWFKGFRVMHHPDFNDALVAQLHFHSWFEAEHGVGFVTDGENILGLGYATEVLPFNTT